MTAVSTTTPTVGPSSRSPRRLGWLLAVILTGQFMAILDVSIVNVAAPTIRTDLGASGSGLQLIISGYTIAYAMLLITGARLGGLNSPRRIFLYGLALFTAASLACGLAGSEGALIAFRLLQGAGSALMVPQVLSLIQINFEGAARAKAISVYATVLSGGVVAGQVLGGLLVSADLFGTAWRPVFLVNVPIGAVLLIAAPRLLPSDHVRRDHGLDLPGLVTLSLAVSLLVIPLVLGHDQDWPVWGWVSMGASVIVFAIFAVVERRAPYPLVPGRILRAPGLVPAALAILIAMASYGAFLFAVAIHLQSGLGDSPLRAGLTFVPAAGAFALASLNWRRVPARLHSATILAGFAVAALAHVALAAILRGGGHGGPLLWIVLVVYGLGFGSAYSPLLSAGLAKIAPADAPDASGAMAMMLQLGQVIGVATFGSLFLSLSPSAHAVSVTNAALAVTVVVAAALALPLLRRR